jgi:predicted adenine nucleotide alpha hydrolase (AANH) superfamily ATPase
MKWNPDAWEEGDEECIELAVLNSFYNDMYESNLDWILMNWIAGLSREIERSLYCCCVDMRIDASPARSIEKLGEMYSYSIPISESRQEMMRR